MRTRLGFRCSVAGAALAALHHRSSQAQPLPASTPPHGQELPASLHAQRFEPTVPYPGWDNNWDYCEPTPKEVAKRVGQPWPITDYAAAIRQLYAEHTDRSESRVDALIEANQDDLPGLFTRAYVAHAHGGGATRHIILVRHGQYEEQRALSRRLHAAAPHSFGLPGDTHYHELDNARVLTPLGREQVAAHRVERRVCTTSRRIMPHP